MAQQRSVGPMLRPSGPLDAATAPLRLSCLLCALMQAPAAAARLYSTPSVRSLTPGDRTFELGSGEAAAGADLDHDIHLAAHIVGDGWSEEGWWRHPARHKTSYSAKCTRRHSLDTRDPQRRGKACHTRQPVQLIAAQQQYEELVEQAAGVADGARLTARQHQGLPTTSRPTASAPSTRRTRYIHYTARQ
jgi:hypothetical protein